MTQLVLPRTAVAPLIVLVLRRVVAGAIGLALAVAPSRADGAQTPSLASLQDAYNKGVYRGIVAMRAPADVGDGHVVGDNTDPNGMRWTKCANLGLDLIATLVADARGIVARGEAREHVSKVVDVLAGLTTYAGIFPEVISFDGGIRPEMVEGRVRYSSIDSAWVTVALSLVDGAYRGKDEGLAARARSSKSKTIRFSSTPMARWAPASGPTHALANATKHFRLRTTI